MNKLFLLLFFYIFSVCCTFANTDYDKLYDEAELFHSKLYNDIDPFQDEDSLKYAWSPYPLFRTSAELYFKTIKIPPGYYLLTPRTLGGKDFILFKENGKVSYIIPVMKKEATPLNFYEANTPQMKKTPWQKFSSGVKKRFYSAAKDSMRIDPPKSLIDIQVEIKYIVMTFYYGESKYTILFRRTPY